MHVCIHAGRVLALRVCCWFWLVLAFSALRLCFPVIFGFSLSAWFFCVCFLLFCSSVVLLLCFCASLLVCFALLLLRFSSFPLFLFCLLLACFYFYMFIFLRFVTSQLVWVALLLHGVSRSFCCFECLELVSVCRCLFVMLLLLLLCFAASLLFRFWLLWFTLLLLRVCLSASNFVVPTLMLPLSSCCVFLLSALLVWFWFNDQGLGFRSLGYVPGKLAITWFSTRVCTWP